MSAQGQTRPSETCPKAGQPGGRGMSNYSLLQDHAEAEAVAEVEVERLPTPLLDYAHYMY